MFLCRNLLQLSPRTAYHTHSHINDYIIIKLLCSQGISLLISSSLYDLYSVVFSVPSVALVLLHLHDFVCHILSISLIWLVVFLKFLCRIVVCTIPKTIPFVAYACLPHLPLLLFNSHYHYSLPCDVNDN